MQCCTNGSITVKTQSVNTKNKKLSDTNKYQKFMHCSFLQWQYKNCSITLRQYSFRNIQSCFIGKSIIGIWIKGGVEWRWNASGQSANRFLISITTYYCYTLYTHLLHYMHTAAAVRFLSEALNPIVLIYYYQKTILLIFFLLTM